jgi:hypothetical protein
MEREVHPHVIREQGSNEQTGKARYHDHTDEEEILRREFVFHRPLTDSATFDTMRRGHYDGVAANSSKNECVRDASAFHSQTSGA